MSTVAIGFALQPDLEFLEHVAPLLDRVDYLEVAPETLWACRSDGAFVPNGFHRRFADVRARTGKRFVAHGVGLSMGTDDAIDADRTRRWLDRIAEDHRVFEFAWYTDHLGFSSVDGLALALPLPILPCEATARTVRARLRAMQAIVPDVGMENTAFYFTLGDPLEEPAFLNRALRGRGRHLLLDLHNVHTAATNFGFDPDVYLDRLDLGRVIEIHVSGGSDSDARWLPGGRVFRLDGHDGAVPEAVWALLERVVPRCAALRGVTLERMEGTVSSRDVPVLRGELVRARRILDGVAGQRASPRRPSRPLAARIPGARAVRAVARAVLADDPVAALGRLGRDPRVPEALRARLAQAGPDGVRLTALLVARLRFERLLRGSADVERWFERDPAGFTAVFRRYHGEVPPRAYFPAGEARLFSDWLTAAGSALLVPGEGAARRDRRDRLPTRGRGEDHGLPRGGRAAPDHRRRTR